jgi:hypothetical protein
MTSERAQKVMNAVWESRNSGGADTENKLTASIVRIVSENVIDYTAQNGLIVLDKNDMLNLASEIESLL